MNKISNEHSKCKITKKITLEKAAEVMQLYCEKSIRGNTETAHAAADKLLLMIIRQYGFGKTANIFQAMKKWYA